MAISQFYGGIQGNQGEATRMGSKDSGFRAYAQSVSSRVTVRYWYGDDGNSATLTIGGGYSTDYRAHTIDFHPDAVAAALNTCEPEIERDWKAIQDAFKRIERNGPRAIKRAHRRRQEMFG
jgi:hypothetical protein